MEQQMEDDETGFQNFNVDEFCDGDDDDNDGPENVENEEETNNEPNETNEASQATEVVMNVGTKKIKITKAKLHPLISRDLFVEGVKKMEQMNIPAVRFQKKCRQKREQCGLHDDLYKFMQSMGDNYDEVSNKIKSANDNEKANSLINCRSRRHNLAKQLRNI
jgi:hypothetical protein